MKPTKPRGVQARPPPGSRSPKSSLAPSVPSAPSASAAPSARSWFSVGLMRVLVLGAIAIGGVAAVMWLRDMGSAAGVNWLR